MGAPGHHAGGSARGPHRPGHGGGGGSTVIYGGPWDYEDPYAEALRLALALEQGRGRSRNA
jgi:hypothetical protein